jgi:hypothetical protein
MKALYKPDTVLYTNNPSTREAEAGGSQCLRLASLGCIYKETLSHTHFPLYKKKKKKNNFLSLGYYKANSFFL